MKGAALAFLLAASCPRTATPEECARLYHRCVEESSSFPEYLVCRDEVDEECRP